MRTSLNLLVTSKNQKGEISSWVFGINKTFNRLKICPFPKLRQSMAPPWAGHKRWRCVTTTVCMVIKPASVCQVKLGIFRLWFSAFATYHPGIDNALEIIAMAKRKNQPLHWKSVWWMRLLPLNQLEASAIDLVKKNVSQAIWVESTPWRKNQSSQIKRP